MSALKLQSIPTPLEGLPKPWHKISNNCNRKFLLALNIKFPAKTCQNSSDFIYVLFWSSSYLFLNWNKLKIIFSNIHFLITCFSSSKFCRFWPKKNVNNVHHRRGKINILFIQRHCNVISIQCDFFLLQRKLEQAQTFHVSFMYFVLMG